MLAPLQQDFTVRHQYTVHFTNGVFAPHNSTLRQVLSSDNATQARKVLAVIDAGVVQHHPSLVAQIRNYIAHHRDFFAMTGEPLIVPGGEAAKNDPRCVEQVLEAIHAQGICRHSYVWAVGGGAVLDMVGYAAAIAHRSVRLVRLPTTVLAQNDSGVGVKNGINYFEKKNFLGTFKPPVAVVNDFDFLTTLDDRDWRAGMAEAVKVALIKDATFFEQIEQDVPRLQARDAAAMHAQIYRCAALHLAHIGQNGDPFELGSSRPLDFGHWAAHKLEQLTHYTLRHGEAVAIGIALDVVYSYLLGWLSARACMRVLDVLQSLGFVLYHEALTYTDPEGKLSVLNGLAEFREHLGGELTIMLLADIGKGQEVHHIDTALMTQAAHLLAQMPGTLPTLSSNF